MDLYRYEVVVPITFYESCTEKADGKATEIARKVCRTKYHDVRRLE